jgi:hypothetical protein
MKAMPIANKRPAFVAQNSADDGRIPANPTAADPVSGPKRPLTALWRT